MMLKNHWGRRLLASFYGGDGKLASVCIFPVIGHGYGTCNAADQKWALSSVLSRLISSSTVSHLVRRGWAWSSRQGRSCYHRWIQSRSVAICEIASLDHEARDDPVECGSLVPQRFAISTNSFLPCVTWKLRVLYNTWQESERAVYCQTVIMEGSLSPVRNFVKEMTRT